MKQVRNICRIVRNYLEVQMYKSYMNCNHDLQGECCLASVLLFREFKKRNYNCLIACNENHFFILLYLNSIEFIVDVTSTQFNFPKPYNTSIQIFKSSELVRLDEYTLHGYESSLQIWNPENTFNDMKELMSFLKDVQWSDTMDDIHDYESIKLYRRSDKNILKTLRNERLRLIKHRSQFWETINKEDKNGIET